MYTNTLSPHRPPYKPKTLPILPPRPKALSPSRDTSSPNSGVSDPSSPRSGGESSKSSLSTSSDQLSPRLSEPDLSPSPSNDSSPLVPRVSSPSPSTSSRLGFLDLATTHKPAVTTINQKSLDKKGKAVCFERAVDYILGSPLSSEELAGQIIKASGLTGEKNDGPCCAEFGDLWVSNNNSYVFRKAIPRGVSYLLILCYVREQFLNKELLKIDPLKIKEWLSSIWNRVERDKKLESIIDEELTIHEKYFKEVELGISEPFRSKVSKKNSHTVLVSPIRAEFESKHTITFTGRPYCDKGAIRLSKYFSYNFLTYDNKYVYEFSKKAIRMGIKDLYTNRNRICARLVSFFLETMGDAYASCGINRQIIKNKIFALSKKIEDQGGTFMPYGSRIITTDELPLIPTNLNEVQTLCCRSNILQVRHTLNLLLQLLRINHLKQLYSSVIITLKGSQYYHSIGIVLIDCGNGITKIILHNPDYPAEPYKHNSLYWKMRISGDFDDKACNVIFENAPIFKENHDMPIAFRCFSSDKNISTYQLVKDDSDKLIPLIKASGEKCLNIWFVLTVLANHYEMARQLIRDVDVNYNEDPSTLDSYINTAFFCYSYEVAKLLIKSGAIIDNNESFQEFCKSKPMVERSKGRKMLSLYEEYKKK